MTFLTQLLAVLLPQRCQFCATPTRDRPLCAACEADLPWNRCACRSCAAPLPQPQLGSCPACLERAPRFDAAYAAFELRGPVQRAVHRLKYQAGFAEARLLAGLMADELRLRAALPDLLVPVPLHPRRLRQRGYNQALLLARHLGALLNRPVATQLAQRRRATEDQIGKTAAARRRNVRAAFALHEPLAGRHIALVDDVMTTGATLEALARVCRRAGAQYIEAWVAARAP